MASKLESLLPAIKNASDRGLSINAIRAKFLPKSKTKSKDLEAELRESLALLIREGAIWGPLKYGVAQYYFAAGRGPSIETASALVANLVLQAGTKLLSKAGLEKKVTGINGRFFADAIKHAVATQAIVELNCGKSKYYIHRDVVAESFGFEIAPITDALTSPQPTSVSSPALALEDLLPVYHRLKSEQGGFSAVKIFDLMKALNLPKSDLHRLLIEEAKAGRITIHHTTSVELAPEVVDAGIRLPGFTEPFVTVVVKNDR
jgi:hypothetical protein